MSSNLSPTPHTVDPEELWRMFQSLPNEVQSTIYQRMQELAKGDTGAGSLSGAAANADALKSQAFDQFQNLSESERERLRLFLKNSSDRI